MIPERLPAAAYGRAESLLGHNRSRLALRTAVTPRWIGAGSSFWYQVETRARHGVRARRTGDGHAATRVRPRAAGALLLCREPPDYRLAEIPVGPEPLELIGD